MMTELVKTGQLRSNLSSIDRKAACLHRGEGGTEGGAKVREESN